MKAFKVIGNIVFVLLVALGAILIFTFKNLEKNNKFPQSITTTYVNTVTDQNGEEQPFMEVNYCANANGSGEAMFELCFNYYTGIDKTAVKSWGLQLVGNELFYYDRFNGTSWVAIENIEWGIPMIIDIDDELYTVTLDGKYQEKHSEGNLISGLLGIGKAIGSLFAGDINKINEETFRHVYYTTEKYTFKHLAETFMQTIVKSSRGYGEYTLPLVNLQRFFTIKRYDEKSKQFKLLDYSMFNFGYYGIKVSTTGSGVLYAKQSVFNMVAEDSQYNKSGIVDGEYWQNAIIHTVTNNDYDLIYDETKDGYYLTLSPSKIIELNGYEKFKNNVKIDVSTGQFHGKKILGLADYALFGLQINKLEIIGAGYQPFEIKSRALWDTNLKQYVKNGVTVTSAEDAINAGGIRL